MKKIKDTGLKANAPLLKDIKQGKIKKNKQEVNKLIDAFGKLDDLKKLAPKESSYNFIKHADGKKNKNIKKSKNKVATQEKTQEYEYDSLEITNSQKGMPAKQKKSEDKDKKDTPSVRDAKGLKKIEKKKAKKLAMKLKRQQKKANNLELNKAITTSSARRDETMEQKLDGISGSNERKHSVSNEDQKQQISGNEIVDAASKKQLPKKEMFKKKKQKQQKKKEHSATASNTEQLENINTKRDVIYVSGQTNNSVTCGDHKSQNLDAVANKTVGATSSKVLMKKEKKAEKRQIVKDQKLAEKQTRDPAVDTSTVFVGNIPVNTKRIQLETLFKKFGPVKCIRLRSAGGKVLFKHKIRKLAGSLNAYVVLQSKEKAENALSLNGVEFKDNHLRITLATKSSQDQKKDESKKTVFVGNLKYSASEEILHEIFSSCGEIEYVRCIRDGDKGCKGVAYVCFKSSDAVGLALELNGTLVDERPIRVERYNIKKLGAKEAREAQEEKKSKSKMGAKLRLEGKKGKNENTKKSNQTEFDDNKKSKKSEFRGVKVNGFKKQKSKKKKSNDQMLKLAKKIAPKAKTD